MRAKDVRAALELRHPEEQNEWVVLHEPMQIDTLAIRCWTGGRLRCRRVAYEIKVSAGDFARELARPEKRKRAVEIAHAYVFAMPWSLAIECRDRIPEGLGLAGVIERQGQFVARDIVKPKIRVPRPLTDEEVAYLVRHRTAPPALRHALMERLERNQELRRIRDRADMAQRALGELARDHVRPGMELRPEWSDYGVRVVSEPRVTRGKILVRVRSTSVAAGREPHEYEQDLGELLGMGYRVVVEELELQEGLTPA